MGSADQDIRVPTNTTPEAAALCLLEMLMQVENKHLSHGFPESASVEWLLTAYGSCLKTVRQPDFPHEAIESYRKRFPAEK